MSDDAPTFERYVHQMDTAELRKALHDMTVVVAHLVVMAGGKVRIDVFDSPDINGGWVAVRHAPDGSLTLQYCATRDEVDHVTAAIALRRAPPH